MQNSVFPSQQTEVRINFYFTVIRVLFQCLFNFAYMPMEFMEFELITMETNWHIFTNDILFFEPNQLKIDRFEIDMLLNENDEILSANDILTENDTIITTTLKLQSKILKSIIQTN